MKIEIGQTYKDISVPSAPRFVVESVKDGIAKGRYVGDGGPSYVAVDQLRGAKI